MKHIGIFAGGTWNSPEKGSASNVLNMARGIKPETASAKQVVFYEFGILLN